MNEQDQRVRDYYQNMSMPKDKLNKLLSLDIGESQADAKALASSSFIAQVFKRCVSSMLVTGDTHDTRQRRSAFLGAGAACMALLMVSVWLFSGHAELEHTQRTMREAAMNHTTRLEPEFRGQSLAMLDNSMQKLPFSLSLPKSIDSAFELVGSRYCSLSGELAAHIKLKHSETGKPVSLFVTGNGDALRDVRTEQTTLDGVDVELWREGGLFFALAQRS